MNQKLPVLASILFAALSLWTACKEPTPFGADLLGDQFADYAFTDTITLRCTVQVEDSSLTSDRGSTAAYFLCGELNDPIFGKSTSEIYTLLQAASLNPNFKPDLQTVDSIVLVMRYAPLGFYGDTLQPQTLRVLRLSERLKWDSTYYSTQSIPEGQELGRVNNWLPRPNATDSLFDGLKSAAFLRVRLSNDFGRELMTLDSAKLANDTAFYGALRGLKIVASANGASPGAMLAFNLNDQSYSRVRLYYTQDSVQKTFDYYFRGTNKFTHFVNEHSSGTANQYIGQESGELLFAQGMQGLRLKVEFPYAYLLNNIAVNKAQLVLTAADVPGDLDALYPADQLVSTVLQGDSLFVFSDDAAYSLTPTLSGGFVNFGGFPEKENVGGLLVDRYRISLSDQFQRMVDDDANPVSTKNRTIYLNVYPKSRSAQRAVFYGPKSLTFPAKLELKYTRVE
jgi:hypothetical protein